MAIIGIPSTRVSDLFVRQRLLSQVQGDLLGLYRVQTQLSTGHRFQLPSEDPVAAMRVVSLQRLLEQNSQFQANLATNQSYLSATEMAISQVSTLMADVRGAALEVVGTTASDTQRKAAAQQVQQALQQLVDSGNQKFRGRYLFAGSQTGITPFQAAQGAFVRYDGNELHLDSYGNVDLLFAGNVQGNEMFGTVSEAVRGSTDLDPVLTWNTRLSDLRQGQGISRGSIVVSDGSKVRVIDLSAAETIGDVARLIHDNPPAGNHIDVEITSRGLVLQLASGNLSINEVGGTTAAELGILTKQGAGPAVVGKDLDPILRATTALTDVLGSRAGAILRPAGPDTDMIIQADHNGSDLNGVTVSLVDDGSVHAGHEQAVYDPVARTLTIFIENNRSEARGVVAAINGAHAMDPATMPFTAAMDPLDAVRGGAGLVNSSTTPPALTHDGRGADLDLAHGLQIANGGAFQPIELSEAVTIEDLLNRLNRQGLGIQAEINEKATGINVRTRLSGADFAIGENGGTTAAQLGLRTFTADTPLESLNFGRGVSDYEGTGASARATLASAGANNNLVIEARQAGPDWNAFTVNVVAAAGPGLEQVAYDPVARTIDIALVPGVTTANQAIQLFNGSAAAADFAIALDAADGSPNSGTGPVMLGSATTAGGEAANADFRITRNDGVSFEIDVHGATTIGEILERINNNAINQDPLLGVPLVARLAAYGNGIELVDNSVGPNRLTVTRINYSLAATDLGLVPPGQESASASTTGALPDLLTGTDVNPRETAGLFTALIRLQHGLLDNDLFEIQRALDMLDEKTVDMNFTRAEMGARQQSLDVLQARLTDEDIELQKNLSLDYDADIAEVVSDLTARQVALEASFRAIAQAAQMSLLNYL